MIYRILIIEFILLLGSNLFSQEGEKIKLEYKNDAGIRINRLVFPTDTIDINYRESATVSPDGNLAAIFKYANLRETYSKVTIFDKSGDSINSFNVTGIGGYMLLTNDGKFILRGSWPGEGIQKPIHVIFYSKEGVEFEDLKLEFGLSTYVISSEKGDIIIVSGIEELWPREFMHTKYFIYNENFNRIGSHEIDDWNALFWAPIIDSNKEIIKIRVPTGMEETFKVDTIYLDYSGNIIKN